MDSGITSRTLIVFAVIGTLVLALPTACEGSPSVTPAINIVSESMGRSPSEVIVYASELPSDALFELDFIDDAASPGGKSIGLPNTGDELDPPPENDPHAVIRIQVQSGIPYRCWIHMKVGEPKGRSTANVVWVQFSDSVDQANQEVFRPGTKSYLTAQGPTHSGWEWVGCDAEGLNVAESPIYFPASGEVTVRIQAGAEGVGFDQFLLSPERFLNGPPTESIVEK